jgi:hypothetical protein
MLAGLFYIHDVWIGEAKVTRYPETNSMLGTENVHIKKYLKSLYRDYVNWSVPIPNIEPMPEFKSTISELVDTDGQWLVKTANLLFTWQAWNDAWPDALWIFPERSLDAIAASAKRHPAMKLRGLKHIESFVDALIERQGVVRSAVKNYYDADTDYIVTHCNAQPMIEKAGLIYHAGRVRKWIKPEKWHGS